MDDDHELHHAEVTLDGDYLVVGAKGDNYFLRMSGSPIEHFELGPGVVIEGTYPALVVDAAWADQPWRPCPEQYVWDPAVDDLIYLNSVVAGFSERGVGKFDVPAMPADL